MGHHAPRHAAPRPRSRQTGRAWGATATLTALAAALVALGLPGSATPVTRVTSSERMPPPVATGTVSARVLERETPSDPAQAARPEVLQIPAIGVATTLLDLGLNDDRTVEVPQDAALAGWYDLGPVPGQVGSAVILGHVDSPAGPAVFHRLRELVAGDRVVTRLSDGSVSTFRVDRVVTYANEDFPARQVYAGSPGRATLNLVTCGGVYDAQRGGYQSNVVVFTERTARG